MGDADIDLKQLQEALRELRETRRPQESVREFARSAGISYTYVAQMEGRAKKKHLKKAPETSPTILMLHRYLRHCGITVTEFFAEFESVTPQGATARQASLIHTMRVLMSAGEHVERRLEERIEDVRAWLTVKEEEKRRKARKKKAS